jgi:uncharacterized protein YydD (DUF2326 family)
MAKSLAKLKEDQAKLEAAIKEAEEKEALRIGRLALSSGLLELNISDGDWKKIFQEAGARFRQKAQEPARQTTS